MTKRWLEVALNGGKGRKWQSTMPITVDEIVEEGLACAAEGAAILHYHAYDPETGLQNERDTEFHLRVMERLRARCNALVYPTTVIRLLGQPALKEERFAVEHALLKQGLLEMFILDPGAMIIAHASELAKSYVYLNETSEIQAGYDLAKTHGVWPAMAIYELGFARLARMVAAAKPGGDPGVYRIMFSDQFSYGIPPSEEAVRITNDAARLLGVSRWMLAGLDFDSKPFLDQALTLGIDIRVGLEDAPRQCGESNLDLVKDAVKRAKRLGVELASPDEIRQELRATA